MTKGGNLRSPNRCISTSLTVQQSCCRTRARGYIMWTLHAADVVYAVLESLRLWHMRQLSHS